MKKGSKNETGSKEMKKRSKKGRKEGVRGVQVLQSRQEKTFTEAGGKRLNTET